MRNWMLLKQMMRVKPSPGMQKKWTQSMDALRKHKRSLWTLGVLGLSTYGAYKVDDHRKKHASIRDLDASFDATLEENEAIPITRMGKMADLEDDEVYAIGFATKRALGIKLGSYSMGHAAISFFDPRDEKYIIVGRQSPSSAGQWRYFYHTRLDDELNYVDEENLFNASQSQVQFNGREAKYLIKKSNALVNKPQQYTLAVSNCYSSTVIVLSEALSMVLNREHVNPQDVFSLLQLLTHVSLQHHYAIGVLNNSVVQASLASSFYMLEEYVRESELSEGYTANQEHLAHKLNDVQRLLVVDPYPSSQRLVE